MFNNIREMDEQLKQLAGKKIIKAFSIQPASGKNIASKYPKLTNPNFVEISAKKLLTLVDVPLDDMDKSKPAFVVLPTFLPWTGKAKFLINGVEVAIVQSVGSSTHENTVYELPAGTTHLKIEVQGKSGDVFSIRNIQIWQ